MSERDDLQDLSRLLVKAFPKHDLVLFAAGAADEGGEISRRFVMASPNADHHMARLIVIAANALRIVKDIAAKRTDLSAGQEGVVLAALSQVEMLQDQFMRTTLGPTDVKAWIEWLRRRAAGEGQ